MFAMEVPYVSPQETPMVLVQAASTTSASVTPDFILNSCRETEHTPNDPRSAWRGLDPAYMLRNYLANKEKLSGVQLENIKVTQLSAPQHGKLTAEVDNTGLTSYRYDPTLGYLGNDRATFMAEYKGKHYKIVVTIKVLLGVDENSPTCPPQTHQSQQQVGLGCSKKRGQVFHYYV